MRWLRLGCMLIASCDNAKWIDKYKIDCSDVIFHICGYKKENFAMLNWNPDRDNELVEKE